VSLKRVLVPATVTVYLDEAAAHCFFGLDDTGAHCFFGLDDTGAQTDFFPLDDAPLDFLTKIFGLGKTA